MFVCLRVRLRARKHSLPTTRVVGERITISHMCEDGEKIFSATAILKSNVWKPLGLASDKSLAVFKIV